MAVNPKDDLRAKLRVRQMAYLRLFNPDSEDVKTVLQDLGRFCRENRSCFDPDPRIHADLEGRREVILRIKDHIQMPFEELWQLLHEGRIKNP